MHLKYIKATDMIEDFPLPIKTEKDNNDRNLKIPDQSKKFSFKFKCKFHVFIIFYDYSINTPRDAIK